MIPTQLTITGYAGQTRTVPLSALTLIAAGNGTGKTTTLEALHLCLTARLPGADRPPSIDDARERGQKWQIEMLDSCGGVVGWSFSGSQLAPSVVIPGRLPPKGKDAVIAAIQERYGAIPTLHAADLATMSPESLARWVVTLCAGHAPAGTALTPEGVATMLAASAGGACPMPEVRPGESVLTYLDRAAQTVDAATSESRSRKVASERDPIRKAEPLRQPFDAEVELARQTSIDADVALSLAEGRLGEARGAGKAALETWQREHQARREQYVQADRVRHDVTAEHLRLQRDLSLLAVPAPCQQPAWSPERPEVADHLDELRAAHAAAMAETTRLDTLTTFAAQRQEALQGGTCPFCGAPSSEDATALDLAVQEADASAAVARAAQREAFRALSDAERVVRDYEEANDRWLHESQAFEVYTVRRESFESKAADLSERIAAAGAAVRAADAALSQLETIPPEPVTDTTAEEAAVLAATAAAENARNTLGVLLQQLKAATEQRARIAAVDAAIETERAAQEKLKTVSSEVARLRSEAVGQAVGPFVSAVNHHLCGALGELVVDLAPTPRVAFRRGEALVPVSRLSGMEAARWMTAAAVAASSLSSSPCQCVLVDDLDRLTDTPRGELLRGLADAVAVGDLGACVCTLAWEGVDRPAAEGWSVVGM